VQRLLSASIACASSRLLYEQRSDGFTEGLDTADLKDAKADHGQRLQQVLPGRSRSSGRLIEYSLTSALESGDSGRRDRFSE
jgi:hypothetical protein